MPYSENAPSSEEFTELAPFIQECHNLKDEVLRNQTTTKTETQGDEDPEISDPKLSEMFFYENYEAVDLQGWGDNLPHIILRENSDGYRELQQLEQWIKERYGSEYNKEENRLKDKYNKPENLLNTWFGDKKPEGIEREYIKYELLMFCLKKYSEEVNTTHQNIITEVYGREDEYKKAMKKASKVFDEIQSIINNTYPGIQTDIQEISKVFDKIEKQRQGWNIKNEKKAEEDYKKYQEESQELAKQYNIENIQKNLNINPQTPEEAKKMGEDLGEILKFSEEDAKLKGKYQVSNYIHYLNNKIFLINEYNFKHNDKNRFFTLTKRIEEYKTSLNEMQQGVYEGFDFRKYQTYLDKIKDKNLNVHFNNLSAFQDILTIKADKDNSKFPITLGKVKEQEIKRIQDEQARQRRRAKLKEDHKVWFHILNNAGALWNGMIQCTVGTGFSLGAMVSNLRHSQGEMEKVYQEKGELMKILTVQRSKESEAPVYSPETGWNLNRDNGPGAVIDSFVAMYTLIYTGGFFGGGLQTLGAGTKLAAGGGLFASGFIYQLGSSCEEGFNVGLRGKDLVEYTITFSALQAGLELVSPNRFILGEGNKVMKQLIADVLKNGKRKTYVQVGKLFLKNMGKEVGEENLQEALQLSAGNLVNMIANDQYKLGENGLNVDWSWENFASTALLTTLTTGITAGAGFKPSEKSRAVLMHQIKNNHDLYMAFRTTLAKAIEGKVTIPGATPKELNDLQKYIEETGNQRRRSEFNHSDYFNNQPLEFSITELQAKENSHFMDNKIEELNTDNKQEILASIRNEIIDQYERATGKKIEDREKFLPAGEIHAIIDAHTEAGKLGEHNLGQLRTKYEILEGVLDYEFIKFLFEAGFCGKIEEVAPNKIKSEYQSGDIKVIFDNGTIQHVKTQHANPDNKDKYCFENEEQIKEVSELFGEELAEFIEEELINTVNWEAGENKNKYILVETEDPQFKYLMVQVQLKEDKTFRVASFYTANQQQINKHDRNLRMKVDKKRPEKSDSQQTKETQNKGTENNETNNRVYDLNTVYTDIIHTPFMEGLNETLTTNAELFMEIAYLPEGNKKLQFKQENEKTRQVLYDGKIITRESFLSTQGKKEWDEIIKLPLDQQYEKFKNLCKREGRRSFLNLLDYNHTFSGEQMLQILLDGKRLDDAEATKKLNNIFQNTLKYCIGEDIGASFIGKYFSNLLKSDYQHLNNNGITPNTTTLTHTLNLYQEKKGNYERNKQQLNHQIQSYIDNNQEIPEALKTAKENLEKGAPSLDMLFSIDGKETVEKLFDELKEKNMSDSDRNKMNFFLRTLFIMSQIENDPTFQDKEERSKDIKQNYLEEFSKRIEEENKKKPEEERIGLTLLENTKTAESTATKISKAKEYACIEDFWDIIRYTYQLESTGEPIKDTQNLINLIGKFSEELIKKQGNGAKEIIFNSKFKGLFDTDAQGNYLYIGSYTVYENYTAITTKDGHTFKIRQKPKHTSGGKATSGEGYKDIKITYEINGIKFELKFVLSERAKNNEKGTSNHDIMRMLENINKTTRKYGLISEEYIHQKIDRIWEDLLYIYKDKTIFYELYNDKALGCKKDSDFSTFDPKNPQDMIKLKEKFQQYVLGKYRKVGEHNGHTYYVYSKEVYLEDVYQNYLKTLKQKDQPLTYEVRLREQLNGGKLSYFDGKISKLRIGIEQARKNSQDMDNLLKFFAEKHSEQELQKEIDALKFTIQEQYKNQTGQIITLTDDQIFSILDAHEQDGKLGELTRGQTRRKVNILTETITNNLLIRFLIEAGFCAKSNCAGFVKKILTQSKEDIFADIDDVLREQKKNVRGINRKLFDIRDEYDREEDISINNRDIIEEAAFQDKRENREYAIIVIYDQEKTSQHIAFIDRYGKFYDQNGPDGPVRYGEDIEDLLDEYKEKLGGKAYYKLYSLTESAETIIAQGLKDLGNEQEN